VINPFNVWLLATHIKIEHNLLTHVKLLSRPAQCQFHQHFTYEFFVLMSFWQLFFYVHVTREKLPKQYSYKKFVCKMLMKLTPIRIHCFCEWFQISKIIKYVTITCWRVCKILLCHLEVRYRIGIPIVWGLG